MESGRRWVKQPENLSGPAVDHQISAVDAARVVGEEEGDECTDFLRIHDVSGGNLIPDLVPYLLNDHRSVHDTRAYGVDCNAGSPKVHEQRPGEIRESGL